MIISWGDGIQNLAFGNLSHHYSKTGRYELSIECDGYTITRNVTIKAAPIARFSYYSTQAMTCKFKNQSENADYSKWEFGDRSSDETRGNAMEKHSYSDTGIQTVKLTARSADGCSSVLQKDIRVRDTRLFVPEILIPGGASENNVFDVSIEGENEFGLTITDANGQLVFRTNDKNRKWDGNDMSGRPCKAGVYVYLLSYQYSGEDRVESNGTVLLKR